MNPVDPTVENEVPLSNVNHEVPQISEVNNEVPQDQPNMTSVAVDASLSTDASPSAIGTRKLTSNVWNHFRRKKVNGMDKAICNYCEKPLSGNRKHGTTHLRRIALTTDMWTASNQRKGFLALIAHFIDDNWTLQSRILRFAYVRSPHTSEVLANVIVKSMMDWNIDRNISTITVDNCSTNDSLINNVLHKLDHSTLMLGGTLFHMRCAAHILNLVVQDDLDVIAPSVEKIRESVAYWRASLKREQKFDDVARIVVHNMNVKKLVLDCKTRWNSTYLMLITAISFKDVFARLRFRDSSYKCFPTEEEWLLAEEVSQILKCVTSPNKVISSMVDRMLSKFEKYWSNIHGSMGIASILDPRYKSKLVEYYFKRIQGEIGFKEPLRRIQKMCYDLLEEYTDNNGHASVEKRSMETRLHTSTDDFLDSFDKEVALECDINTDLKTELDHYLEDKVLSRNVDFDILEWWKTNGTKYPTLMRLARDILAIPISTVASESAFNTSGRLVSNHRSRLHLKTIETLICVQSWLSNEKQATSSQETKAYYSSVEYYEDTIDVDGLLRGSSSLGYLFGSGEAPKSVGESAEPVQKPAFKSTGEPAEPLQKPTPATQVDNKQILAGIQGNLANNYQRADGQNCGNFITLTEVVNRAVLKQVLLRFSTSEQM
ncbi:hypothetical protein ZIOFF_033958 [Zingiber officinale]|uniref:BED-type domain-containing protein n=1 Tax=Zingiber officinale TaxID=94328 RepID=A0A8J5H312_ZINOF|nr:hypothetical protein ZIOFF_033958 [Zingiber officinale]